ncbi:MAG: class I SAM-dependent methyltransferase [Bdellovibrionales bacterium]
MKEAYSLGREIDLSGISYGLSQWLVNGKTQFIQDFPYYYYFLAGFVARKKIKNIIEIGTHMGGSTLSLQRGQHKVGIRDGKIVTIDISDLGNKVLEDKAGIFKLTGPAESPPIFQSIDHFEKPIDLLFIDGLHDYEGTRQQFDIYRKLFKPRYVLVDDIALNPEMKQFWKEVVAKYSSSLNISSVHQETRDPACGMGLVKLR